MDGSLIHIIWTVLLLLIFIGVLVWVYGVRSKEYFDEAARLPLDDDEVEARLDAEQARSNEPDHSDHSDRGR